MLETGAHTEEVSSTTAETPSTTVSSLLASTENTGKSRTHGDPDGEREDSSDFPKETLAISVITP